MAAQEFEATEIGHTALHGGLDKLPGAEPFHSKTFRWRVPIDEESWRDGHDVRHHLYTNVAGRDPDIYFGPVRLTEQTLHRPLHYLNLSLALLAASHLGLGMNLHFNIGPASAGKKTNSRA